MVQDKLLGSLEYFGVATLTTGHILLNCAPLCSSRLQSWRVRGLAGTKFVTGARHFKCKSRLSGHNPNNYSNKLPLGHVVGINAESERVATFF